MKMISIWHLYIYMPITYIIECDMEHVKLKLNNCVSPTPSWNKYNSGCFHPNNSFNLHNLPLMKAEVLFLKDFIYLFLEIGKWKEKERERNINAWLSLTCPPLGTWPTMQACAPTGKWTSGPLQSSAQYTEPHQPGMKADVLNSTFK